MNLTYDDVVRLQRELWRDDRAADPAAVDKFDQALTELRDLAVQAGMSAADAERRPITALWHFVARDSAPVAVRTVQVTEDGDVLFA